MPGFNAIGFNAAGFNVLGSAYVPPSNSTTPAIDPSRIPSARRVNFSGGTRVVQFSGGTRKVVF